MNACPAFPETPVALAFALIHRIVAFLALCIRPSGLGTISAVTLQTRASIVAFTDRLLAVAPHVARRADACATGDAVKARATPSRRASQKCGRRASVGKPRATPSAREQFRWMVAFMPAPLHDAFVAWTAHSANPLAMARARRSHAHAANSVRTRAIGVEMALSTGADEGARAASCEFSTDFRNWVGALGW